ncbi:hypothetical protein [Shimia sp. SDUM112013]|uniref:hypothetical protein n=1 Tax=Shimia sp. SDUM112013 TaxID=3136160 RepID=UPI0032EB465A
MKRIEKEYEQGRLLQQPTQTTVGELIDMVVKSHRKDLGKTKKQVLTAIKRFDVAGYEVASLKTSDLIEFATQVAEGGHGQSARTPSTTANYMSHLSGCLRLALPVFDIPFERQIVTEAREATTLLGVTGKSKRRTRRPSLEELDAFDQPHLSGPV